MLGFALFFTWGMGLLKKSPGADKRLLTLAAFVLLTAAVDRIQRNNSFPSLGMDYPAFSFIYLNILLIPLFLYDLITLRRVQRITWIGVAIVFLFQTAVITVFGSPSWHKFWFELTAPLVEKVVEVQLSDGQSGPLLGNYESTIENMPVTITISRNNGKFYMQFGGEKKQEAGAISETELFLKGESMNFSFIKGPDGLVTSAEATQVGRIYKMSKVKQP
jgi:hypothetical protein